MAMKVLTYAGLYYILNKLANIFAPLVHSHSVADITDVELTEDSEAEMVVPIESETLIDIVNGDYETSDTEMFTGNSQYTPLTSAQIDALVDRTIAAMQPTEEQN